jgi:hypothetical protein
MSESDQEQDLRRVSMSSQTEYISANQIQLLCSRPAHPRKGTIFCFPGRLCTLASKRKHHTTVRTTFATLKKAENGKLDFVIEQSSLLYIDGRNREEAFHTLLEIL